MAPTQPLHTAPVLRQESTENLVLNIMWCRQPETKQGIDLCSKCVIWTLSRMHSALIFNRLKPSWADCHSFAHDALSVLKMSAPCICDRVHITHFDLTPQLLYPTCCKRTLLHTKYAHVAGFSPANPDSEGLPNLDSQKLVSRHF